MRFRRWLPGNSGSRSLGEDLVERHVFEISRLADRTGLKLAGDLDLHSAGKLAEALTAFQEAGEVWLDMTEITFIDSSGLSSILSFARSRNGHGRIVILDPTSVVGPVFKIIGVDNETGIEVLARRPGCAPLLSTQLDPALTTSDR
jgi:anti-anti-sigma factor